MGSEGGAEVLPMPQTNFYIRINTQGEYYWVLIDGNYRKIAYSGEAYVSKYNCERAIANVKRDILSAGTVDDT